MIIFKTKILIKGIKGEQHTNFMVNCTDNQYKRRWSGTHLSFHTLREYSQKVGNLVFF